MTQEDIERMTREAGCFDATPEFLARFAALVAAAENRACAKVCNDLYKKWVDDLIDETDEEVEPTPPDWVDCNLAIRARGQQIDPNQWAFDNGLEST